MVIMDSISPASTLAASFLQPLDRLSLPPGLGRACHRLSDTDFLLLGLSRTLGVEVSGRAFLDAIEAPVAQIPSRSSFFEALGSRRRLEQLMALNEALASHLSVSLSADDPFACFPELQGYTLLAGDGHWIGAAAHDPRDINGNKHPTGHVYLMDLRNQAIRHLDLCDPVNKRREHDISVLKRTWTALRRNTPKGRPLLLVWDRAIIDYRFLQKAKDQAGIYFVTRDKSNSNLTRVGLRSVAPIPVNDGIVSDELAAPAATGRTIRRITWTDPDTGETWSYLTNDMKLEPGLIVLVYRRRWDIEKSFDGFKNKLHEKKSWATSPVAKTMQAIFLCLLHNLMVSYEAGLAKAGIRNEAEEKRREKVLTRRTERVEKAGRKMPLIIRAFQRITQRTVKFIRWLRRFLWQKRPLHEILPILTKRYATL